MQIFYVFWRNADLYIIQKINRRSLKFIQTHDYWGKCAQLRILIANAGGRICLIFFLFAGFLPPVRRAVFKQIVIYGV